MKTVSTGFLTLFLLSTASLAAAQPTRTASTTKPGPSPSATAPIKPVPSVSPSAPTAHLPADYRLVVGDKLRIEVYKDTQLSQSLQVRPDGKITLPLVGDIVAAGLTPLALRDSITTSLKEYVTNPVVTVIVVETEPPTVSVVGEVNTPGVHQLKGPTTVLEVLAMAGGFKDFAKTKSITIRRNTSTGVQRIPFNYNEAIKGDGKPVYVQAGDIIIVP